MAPVYAEAVENLSDLRALHTPDGPHPELVGPLLWRAPSGARDRAARRVDAATDAQRAAAQRQYADAGAIVREHELTAGVVVRVVGTTVAWQSDLGWLRADRAQGSRDELRGRTQLQLAF